ncbi:hypothetical protein [Saccharomonospora saliphila]|uniref:hypothetical protein n=1 Tax=Saccharomonospora saliphila TaxID=369829 RepID=UPI00049003D5|nr:hypothetical protein [Saccharomonospora saliphila]
MPFNVTFSPGPAAVAGTRTFCFVDESATLVVYADPDCLTIETPRDPVLWPEFAKFLRQLRNAADDLVEWLERESTCPGMEQQE